MKSTITLSEAEIRLIQAYRRLDANGRIYVEHFTEIYADSKAKAQAKPRLQVISGGRRQ